MLASLTLIQKLSYGNYILYAFEKPNLLPLIRLP